jgi:uncharacterized cupredoxin-like copper-binding protein
MIKKIARLSLVALFLSGIVWAEGDLTQQQPIDISIELGNKKGEFKFFPSHLNFETGKLYRLILSNPSPQKHYFSSDEFSRAIYTRKVQINKEDSSTVVEVKGHIREIEVYPNGRAEWWFVAVKSGQFNDLKCTIKGHVEAGMVGDITIH